MLMRALLTYFILYDLEACGMVSANISQGRSTSISTIQEDASRHPVGHCKQDSVNSVAEIWVSYCTVIKATRFVTLANSAS
jgi:hypothetical protein